MSFRLAGRVFRLAGREFPNIALSLVPGISNALVCCKHVFKTYLVDIYKERVIRVTLEKPGYKFCYSSDVRAWHCRA